MRADNPKLRRTIRWLRIARTSDTEPSAKMLAAAMGISQTHAYRCLEAARSCLEREGKPVIRKMGKWKRASTHPMPGYVYEFGGAGTMDNEHRNGGFTTEALSRLMTLIRDVPIHFPVRRELSHLLFMRGPRIREISKSEIATILEGGDK